jgi:ornithine cyclodeaminase/alanine dehydrogenase-like protein (mu-crystallin family)
MYWHANADGSQIDFMELRVLSRHDVRAAIDVAGAREAMRVAFSGLSAGTASVPARTQLESDAGVTLFMPAYLAADDGAAGALGAKVVSVFEQNRGLGLPAITGLVVLLDPGTGLPMAILDGTHLTSLRTAAGSALATELLARPQASVLTLFGAGVQGRAHVPAIRDVRPIEELRIVDPSREAAERLAAEVTGIPARVMTDREAAVRDADLVVTATTSVSPVFPGEALPAGAHICAVGSFKPTMQELDVTTVRRARVIVDSREGALSEAGDLIVPIRDGRLPESHIDAELGEIINGEAPRGRLGHDLTLFKSVGNAAQDVAIASRILDASIQRGLGTVIEV